MSRLTLVVNKPERLTAIYGREASLGYYCTVFRGEEKIAEYDAHTPGYDGLTGLLRTLVTSGILTQAGVDEALEYLPHVEDLCNIPSEAGQLAGAVIENLGAPNGGRSE